MYARIKPNIANSKNTSAIDTAKIKMDQNTNSIKYNRKMV